MSNTSTTREAKPPSNQPLLRVSLFFKRRSDITEKEFNDHWSNVHAPLTKEWLIKYGIVRYTQYHTPASLRGPALESFPELKEAGLPSLPYDGVVEMVVRDVADFAKARQDPFYKEHVVPDEEKMVDRGDVSWTVGWEEVKIDVEGVDREYAKEVQGRLEVA